jgi:adenylylsulfate kinase
MIVWLTGLSGSGKTTIANAIGDTVNWLVLDGDIVRSGLCSDLGFTEKDRRENIRRIGELCKILDNADLNVITAFISPYERDREFVKSIVPVFEVYLDCPLHECERRDPKGLYKKVRDGDIKNFTGIDSPYEIPSNPDLILNTMEKTVTECVIEILDLVYS